MDKLFLLGGLGTLFFMAHFLLSSGFQELASYTKEIVEAYDTRNAYILGFILIIVLFAAYIITLGIVFDWIIFLLTNIWVIK